MCRRCGRIRITPTLCAWCLAYDLEKRIRDYSHDRAEHAWMLILSHLPESCCAVSGLTRDELARIGDRLTVDRIDNDRGYTRGNMQLLAGSLNREKWMFDRYYLPGAMQALGGSVVRMRQELDGAS